MTIGDLFDLFSKNLAFMATVFALGFGAAAGIALGFKAVGWCPIKVIINNNFYVADAPSGEGR